MSLGILFKVFITLSLKQERKILSTQHSSSQYFNDDGVSLTMKSLLV